METKIGPDFRKPFRGLTTIQLFDKNTGELLEEYHDENTYNDRLQYINYLNTILHCQPPAIASQVPEFKLTLSDVASHNTLNSYKQYAAGATRNSESVWQLFANLVLTAGTSAESAHGYFNGIPVGVSTVGDDSVFAAKGCTGILNASESYLGNDRLHLVFDFATDKCNVSFDALWLFPSTRRRYDSSYEISNYEFVALNQKVLIESKPIDFSFNNQYINCISVELNNNYTALCYTTSNSLRYVNAITILNNRTGSPVISYDFGTTPVNLYGPFYYDAGSTTLYTIYQEYKYAYYLLTNNNSHKVRKVNLTDGTFTDIDTVYNMLGITYDNTNFNPSTSSNYNCDGAFVFTYKDNNAYLAVRIHAQDVSSLEETGYIFMYQFDVVSESFTLLKKHRNYGNFMSSMWFLLNGLLYTTAIVDANRKEGNGWTVFDIATGNVKAANLLSMSSNALTQDGMSYYYMNSSYSTYYVCHDTQVLHEPLYEVSQVSLAGAKLLKNTYMTALWSTHNKLTSVIKKTDLTTMKIQYDIVWDSILEKIVPALK